MMTPYKINKIFDLFHQHNQQPNTELRFQSHFELLVAVILSAQATDVSVNKATQVLYKVANTPEQLLQLGVIGLKKYIKSIGLYNTKASNIIKTCKILIEQHNSEVPSERKALEALPGVGRKTANVVLNTAFGQPTMAVDTHIFRISNRIGIAPGTTVRQVEDGLLKVIPKKYLLDAHQWLILHGRYTCTARKPQCSNCIIHRYCEYEDKHHDV